MFDIQMVTEQSTLDIKLKTGYNYVFNGVRMKSLIISMFDDYLA